MKAPPATNAIKKDKKSDLILRTKNKQSDLYLFLSSCQRKFVIIKNKKAPSFSISESSFCALFYKEISRLKYIREVINISPFKNLIFVSSKEHECCIFS